MVGDTAIKLHLADRFAQERGKNPSLAFEAATGGLDMLLDKVDTDHQLSVLDLGSPNQSVVDMLYGMRVRLHMGDLFSGLGWSIQPASESASMQQSTSLTLNKTPLRDEQVTSSLSHVTNQRFDAIFAWDLLNYFTPAEASIVLHHLRVLSHPGTLFHSFIFISDTMPSVPSKLTATRRRRLRYEPQTDQLTPVDPALAPCIDQHLPGYTLSDDTHFGSILSEQLRVFKTAKSDVA